MHQQLWGEVFHQVNSWRAILNVETEQRVLRAAHDQGMTLKAAAWNLVEHSEKKDIHSLYSHEIKIGQKLFLRWFLEIYFCNSSTNTTNNDNNNNNNNNNHNNNNKP